MGQNHGSQRKNGAANTGDANANPQFKRGVTTPSQPTAPASESASRSTAGGQAGPPDYLSRSGAAFHSVRAQKGGASGLKSLKALTEKKFQSMTLGRNASRQLTRKSTKHKFVERRQKFRNEWQMVTGNGDSYAAQATEDSASASSAASSSSASSSSSSSSHGGVAGPPAASSTTSTAAVPQTTQKELSDEEKRAIKRSQVMEEIVKSEKLYVKFLNIMLHKFVKPMGGMIPQSDHSILFGNVESIASFHSLLAVDLNDVGIVGTFEKFAAFLKMYMPYINNYDQAIKKLNKLKRKPHVNKFITAARKDTECGGLGITSYLIMPIQRIPRYRLLLEQLLKYTAQDDPQRGSLEAVLAKVKDVAARVNESKREIENLAKLTEIATRIDCHTDFDLIAPHRHLLREGALQRLTTKVKPTHVFLFNDVLLWTTSAPANRFRGALKLSTATVSKLDASASSSSLTVPNAKSKAKFSSLRLKKGKPHVVLALQYAGRGFSLRCPGLDKQLTLVFETAAESDSWYKAVQQAAATSKQISSNLRVQRHRARTKLHSHIQSSLMGLKGAIEKKKQELREQEELSMASETVNESQITRSASASVLNTSNYFADSSSEDEESVTFRSVNTAMNQQRRSLLSSPPKQGKLDAMAAAGRNKSHTVMTKRSPPPPKNPSQAAPGSASTSAAAHSRKMTLEDVLGNSAI